MLKRAWAFTNRIMIKISKVKASEILSFADDSNFVGWEHIPISLYRAISYSSNPRSNPDDIVLYLAFENEILIGYRTIMADLIHVADKEIKVGWLSGNWVLNKYRRKGIASLLLKEALKDWNNHLLYTNYALESKAVYDKPDRFELLSTNPGQRYYLRSCLATLLPPRSVYFSKMKIVLKIVDGILNWINPLPLMATLGKEDHHISTGYLSQPDDFVHAMFESECEATPTRRTRVELSWVLKFPWLVSSDLRRKEDKRYYFSSNPKRFEQLIIKVCYSGTPIGFMVVNLIDDKLTVPYSAFSKNDSNHFAKILLKHAAKLGVSMITIYESNLVSALNQRFLIKIFSKERYQNYFSTKEIANELKSNVVIFRAGDGDCAFV